MDFEDTATEAAFRAEVRHFLEANATRRQAGQAESEQLDVQASRAWQARKAQAGLAGILIPTEFGGRGGLPIEQVIYDQEEAQFRTPPGRLFMITFGMCIPTMIEFARPEDGKRHARAAIQGDEVWCQLFSEPAGGSDLAALRTRAERQGDEWIVNGQKIWTSYAHHSDYGLLLARTDFDAPKHGGLTAFFVDMKSPGIEVRPIKQIDGSSHFNEVFLTDVVIPDTQRLGAVGDGWKVALFTLMNERVAVGRVDGPDFAMLVAGLRDVERDGRPALAHPTVRDWLARSYVLSAGQQHTMSRVVTALSKGRQPGPEASVLKLVGARQLIDTAATMLDFMGPAGAISDVDERSDGYFQDLFLRATGERIAGGTEEIMLNVLAERVLKLPGDMRADKGIPFRTIGTQAAAGGRP
ncbi:acyl-CoA dehydrogenase family protein [Sphingomonas sp. MG17]|uniref:Acyl-CoA dehydrogenase family protein n=1 Tax=Sphingomonas tagetis TaxID=2949092 RepID=A0A9X2HMZ4_9SPHN|nr:acyl-CoA dehydrogenase family protein [Sphingomonas tagetis]MCP3730308.1 acyl-CoA dehydrogenase family protein [Sphingomonas tagetis]